MALVISYMPVISFAEEGNEAPRGVSYHGATPEDPFVLSKDNKVITYELESYPFESTNYKLVRDDNASGGAGLICNKYLLKETYKYKVPGNLCHYRLYVKTEDKTAIKIYFRAKSSNTSAKIAMSLNDDLTAERSVFLENGVGNYAWIAADAYDLPGNELSVINLLFYSARSTFDKIVITSDLLYFPSGMGDDYDGITLGEDTTDYENLKYPLPPFSPKKVRPRILLSPQKLETVRANISHPENAPMYDIVVKNANTLPKSWDITVCNKYIWANAFLWQLNGDKEAGQKAVDALFNSFYAESSVSTSREKKSGLNDRSYQMLVLAIVYDWCNDFLSDEQKLDIIGHMLFYAAQLEYPYPPMVNGRENGHESEGEIFTAQFSCSMAIYEDYPEMYNIIGGKIFEQMLSTRNFYYNMKNHSQGTHYNTTRMLHEFYLAALLESGVTSGLVNIEGAVDCLIDSIAGLRPDSQLVVKGDDNQSGAARSSFGGQAGTFFFWGNFAKDPYIRDTFFRYHPNVTLSYGLTNINHVMWLIYNDPSVGRKSYKEYPNLIYMGDQSGIMYARNSWELGDEDYSDQFMVRLNMETHFAKGHDHLDTGHFDIYYKGALAIDSGHYPGVSSPHHYSYAQNSIAHNTMILYDPEEPIDHNGKPAANDGGQQYKYAMDGSLERLHTVGTVAKILGADYGDDMKNPSFAYLKGDLTTAYWEGKMEHYTRSFVYLNFFDETYPGALIVFDRMISKKPELKKTWLLHTQQEPIINKENAMTIADKTEEGDNGRLINQTLYPKKENLVLETIGGEGKEYWVNGTNFDYNKDGSKVHPVEHKDYGEWRLEVSPKERVAEDCFLNVLHATEADDSIKPLEAELIEAGNFLGAKIKDRVAFFNKNEGRTSETITFNLTGEENYEILFTDVSEGQWIIYKNGKEYDRQIATENGGDFKFNGTKGEYTVKKNNRSPLTFKRDMNFRNYLTPVGNDYEYFEINSLWYDFEYIKEGEKIFVNASKITKPLNSEVTINGDEITLKGKFKDFTFKKDSESIRYKDGIWYIDLDALSEIASTRVARNDEHVYTITGGISMKEFEFLRRDGEANVVAVTTPDEYYDASSPPEYVADTEASTRWLTDIIGNSVEIELDHLYEIKGVNINWTSAGRGHYMKVETSVDGVEWVDVFDGVTDSASSTSKPVYTEFEPSVAKYVRITGSGNTQGSAWFGIYSLNFPVDGVYEELETSDDEEEEETTEDENSSDIEQGIVKEDEENEDDEEEEEEEEEEGESGNI